MPFYQITLNQGRTDTFIVEADSVHDIKTFYETVSTAKITSIKKIVYSKDLGVGGSLTSFTPNNNDIFLNIMVKNKKGICGTLNINFPIKNISSEMIAKYIKIYFLLDDSEIVEIINIIRANEGLAPTGAE